MSLDPKVAVIRWRSKTREQLAAMLQDSDWRCYKAAIRDLRRRGEDVSAPLLERFGVKR